MIRQLRYSLAVALWRLADLLDDVAVAIDPRERRR